MAKRSTKKAETTPDDEDDDDEDDIGIGELTLIEAKRNFRRAWEAKELFLDEASDDVLFALGYQWDPADAKTLSDAGVRPLTINQIAPILRLMKGVESQNRSELRAVPEGGEDGLTAEIISRLMKAAGKQCDLDYKFSEMFENGNGVGRSSLEPYLDYPYKADRDGVVDMLAQLCVKVRHHNTMFEDPASVEYDHADAAYWCKFTTDLTKIQLMNLFPKMRDKIKTLKAGKIVIDAIPLEVDGSGISVQHKGYDDADKGSWTPKNGFDLVDHYYRKWTEKWYIVDAKIGKTVVAAGGEEEARRYVEKATAGEPEDQKSARYFSKFQSEVWVAFFTGGLDEFLYNGPAWSAPFFDNFPLFDYYAYRSTAPVEKNHRGLLIQGITRGAKDSNRELNKRRTQELRNLNQSTNSGWIVQDDAMTPKQFEHLRKFGGTPGVIIKYQANKPIPVRIEPTQLSQGHAQMAQEHRQDLRDTVGLNTETLSVESDQSSGRAIAQRIKQGMTQVQGLFDNYARTRRNFGRFLISVLPKIFDVDRVKRTVGEQFLQENFRSPVIAPVVDPKTGTPVMDPATGKPATAPQVGPDGQPVTQYDENLANQAITRILQDAGIGVYDVAVGEIVAAATTMYGQFQEALELRAQGVPVPPDVLVNRSSLPEADKKKTIAALQAAAQQPQQPSKKAA